MSGTGSAELPAPVPRDLWNYTIQYHDLVLLAVPAGCRRALDVGSGTGLVTLKLARSSENVIGIDFDRQALSMARVSREFAFDAEPASRVHFVEGDVLSAPFPPASFDFISAVAALHHLPLRSALTLFRDLLRPGGTLAVIGLYRSQTITDFAMNVTAWPISRVLRVARGCHQPATRKRAPQETLAEIRSACREVLPGAVVKRLLLFRYSLIWRKP